VGEIEWLGEEVWVASSVYNARSGREIERIWGCSVRPKLRGNKQRRLEVITDNNIGKKGHRTTCRLDKWGNGPLRETRKRLG